MATVAHSKRTVLLLGLFAFFSGCKTYHYRIELRPDNDAMNRKLTCWLVETVNGKDGRLLEFPANELTKIASVYDSKPDENRVKKHEFHGRFAGKMPVDIQNHGNFARWTSPFGTASLYLERFGGNDDLVGQIEERRKACDRLVDLVIEWLEGELGKEPNWRVVRHWLDVDVRRDLANISFTILTASSTASSSESDAKLEDVAIRCLQYLVEREYLTPKDLPALTALDGSMIAQEFDRRIGRKLGLADEAPRPRSMDFLRDANALSASLDGYLGARPEFARLKEEWKKKYGSGAEPQPIDVLFEYAKVGLFDFPLFGDTTELDVTLAIGMEPVFTNGKWEEESKQVRWKIDMNGKQGLPTQLHAQWAEPNETEQIKHFGVPVFTQQELFDYVLWYNSLGKLEKSEWDAFVNSLHPDDRLVENLRKFRFSSDPEVKGVVQTGAEVGKAFGTISRIIEKLSKSAPADEK
ncbi:MAG: hypothetical protein U1D30_21790 [Planctomycetota bacterium]